MSAASVSRSGGRLLAKRRTEWPCQAAGTPCARAASRTGECHSVSDTVTEWWC